MASSNKHQKRTAKLVADCVLLFPNGDHLQTNRRSKNFSAVRNAHRHRNGLMIRRPIVGLGATEI
jgi:hypothetical protein